MVAILLRFHAHKSQTISGRIESHTRRRRGEDLCAYFSCSGVRNMNIQANVRCTKRKRIIWYNIVYKSQYHEHEMRAKREFIHLIMRAFHWGVVVVR